MSEVPKKLTRAVNDDGSLHVRKVVPIGIILKSCPFCGGPAALEEVDHSGYVAWSVGCNNQDVDCIAYQMLATFTRKSEAAEAWNKRVGEE